MIALVPNIRARDWQPALGEIGAVVVDLEDIAQAIRIIVTTPLGSDPANGACGGGLADPYRVFGRPYRAPKMPIAA